MGGTNHPDGNGGPAETMASPVRYKESGNKFIAMKKYSAALACYRRGLEELPDAADRSPQGKEEIKKLEVALRSNLALALLKLVHSPDLSADETQRRKHCLECQKECSIVLELDASNSKILYRRGQAQVLLAAECGSSARWRWSDAEDDFTHCVKILQTQLEQQKARGSPAKAMKATMQQINDAKKQLKKMNEQQALIQKNILNSDEPFPWHVPTLLARCPEPESLALGGCIVRGVLTDAEQQWLYNKLYSAVDICDDSPEMLGLRMTRNEAGHRRHNPDNRPQPFVTWVHPYTRESNTRERPARLLEWAQELMHSLAPDSESQLVNSMLAQLYAHGGSLLRHRDEDLSWGIGVSLGCAAEFDCLPEGGKAQRVVIRSGDIIVGEFGKMPHAVVVPVEDNEPPNWWRRVDSFGTKRRCNVLFREALSKERQLELADGRARKVYGMSLDALKRKTGKDDGYLSVHLRHLALE
mmetsp:Transcript_59628/g.126755  ORF Transcript_59628/g.126755 Transcript_59628/m.126755 type:complete len:471 (-) Transcript_59628:47-1459(-)